ncbi:MAG: hypothetical protein PVF70_10590 [Anaerolineales bacterium]
MSYPAMGGRWEKTPGAVDAALPTAQRKLGDFVCGEVSASGVALNAA